MNKNDVEQFAIELLAANQAFHRLLTEGVRVTVRKDGGERGEIVWLADFDCPESNEFLAVNQLTVVENDQQKRPDLVLFVNGLPLAVIELKNPADENATLESAFRQLIDQAMTSEKVVDIFNAAGIRKPDLSILSEEFLLELRGLEHKNIALEVLKKLLNDEIRARAKKNLVQSSSLLELLEKTVQRYHRKIVTAAEVIEELISIAQEIRQMDKETAETGLTDFEYAFYAAVASNKSAAELMQKEKMRELAAWF